MKDDDHTFFLDSAASGASSVGPTGRFSFFGGRPHLIIRSRGLRIEVIEAGVGGQGSGGHPAKLGADEGWTRIEFGNPLHLVRAFLRSAQLSPVTPLACHPSSHVQGPSSKRSSDGRRTPPAPLPFAGGFVGYLAYDMAHFFERLPCTTEDDLGLPELYFIMPSYVVVVDQVEGAAYLVAIGRGKTEEEAERKAAKCAEELSTQLQQAPALGDSGAWEDSSFVIRHSSLPGMDVDLTSDFTREEYEDAIARVKRYIAAGDIIQANIAQRLEAPFAGDPFELYRALRGINPSPFAFYFHFEKVTLASCSPERLLEVRGDGIQTRPIAGTRPRGATDAEDLRLRAELLLSDKERAEHIMLVDLERNDLGRICRYGSVRVDELMTVEQYSHVFHIVSNVSGRLRPGCDAIDAIAACFPGGTITGAPKIRCMEIIDEVERHRRGPYTGSAGYISFEGEMDLNIIIRTFILTQGKAYIHVGGGIVADSDPASEYEETLHKARALIEALSEVGPLPSGRSRPPAGG